MLLASWNVNGLRACLGKGFTDFFHELNADILCLQETKMQQGQAEVDFDGYRQYWNSAVKKGYSGTAVFTRLAPLKVEYGINMEEHDQEGRVITLEFEPFYLVNVYTPNLSGYTDTSWAQGWSGGQSPQAAPQQFAPVEMLEPPSATLY